MNNVVAKRRCDYKGCNEFRDKANLNPDITFFSFPSDPERTKKWLEASQTTSDNPKYICSKHFEDKYISRVQRRVHLVISAVPNNYNAIVSECKEDIKNKSYGNECNDSEYEEDEQIIFELLKNDLNINKKPKEPTLDNINLDQNFQKSSNILLNSISINRYRKQKKYVELSPKNLGCNDSKSRQEQLFKFVKLANGKVVKVNKSNLEEKIDFEGNESKIKVDNSNINALNEPEPKKIKTNETCSKVKSILIQNEEYIQMPKSLYIKERMELLNKIEHYKTILKEFKEKLNDVDCS